MAFGSRQAGTADVTFRADVGRFRADVNEARQLYERSTGAMSDAALKQAVAQERLDRAIKRYGAESLQAKQATLAYRNEMRALTTQVDRTDRELEQTRRTLERTSRGALAGSGAFRSLRGSIAFASAGFLSGAGLVYGMRQAVSVASNLEEQTDKVSRVFGESTESVLAWSKTSATAMGIARDRALEYAGSLGKMLIALEIAPERAADMSQALVQLASDMASFSNEDPSEMLERIRSGLAGEVEPLRRFGVVLSAARVEQHAWTVGIAESGKKLDDNQKLLARYSLLMKDTATEQGNFAATADSLANSQRTLGALWRDAQSILGQALAPSVRDVVRELSAWLGDAQNQAELQRNVNTVVKDGAAVARGLAWGVKAISQELSPLIKLLGGLDRAVEIALVVGVVKKSGLAALAMRGIAAASARTRVQIEADAAAEIAALNAVAAAAGRTAGAMAGIGAAGFVGVRGGRNAKVVGTVGRLGRFGRLVPGVGTALTAGLLLDAFTGGHGARLIEGQISENGLSDESFAKLKQAARNGRFDYEDLERFSPYISDEHERELRRLIALAKRPTQTGPEEGAAGQSIRAEQNRRRRRRRAARTFTFSDVVRGQARLEEAFVDAQGTRGSADDVRVLSEEIRLLDRAIDELELSRDQRLELKRRRLDLVRQIEAIRDDEQREADAIKAKATEARKRREELGRAREETRMKAIQEVAAKQATRRAKLFDEIGSLDSREELRRAALRHVRGGKDVDAGEPVTREQVQAMQFEFLQSLQGLFNQFGGNLFSGGDFGGQVATESAVQSHLLRRQNEVLEHLAAGARQPASRYGYRVLTSAFDGYSF